MIQKIYKWPRRTFVVSLLFIFLYSKINVIKKNINKYIISVLEASIRISVGKQVPTIANTTSRRQNTLVLYQ